jgi:subtilisin-like proprotein convertase family protein
MKKETGGMSAGRVTGRARLLRAVLAVAAVTVLLAGGADAASVTGSKSSNVNIPDRGSWVYSAITISGAPAGATITGIDCYFRCVHTYAGDLEVDLEVGTYSNWKRLWDNEGGSADNPSRTTTGITGFNGLPVNNTWYLYARDTASGDTGYIDEWRITIYYNAASPPGISSVSPNPATGANSSQSLTIYGNGFQSGAQLRIREPTYNVDVTKTATYVSSSQLRVNLTYGNDPTTWSAQVINPDGYSSSQYSFPVNAPPPLITSISPASANAGSGAFNLTVNGSTFHHASVVRWNGSSRPSTLLYSGGLVSGLRAAINASDISSPGSASVTVYSPGPGGGTSGGKTFTVGSSGPTISGVSPSSVIGANSAQTLTIYGSSFQSPAQVRIRAPAFGVDTTKSATYVNSGQVQVSATFGTDPATWNVQVINPGPAFSGTYDFPVNAPPPAITSLKPSNAAAGSGSFSLYVGGSTFHDGSVVRWNGASRSTTLQTTPGGLVTGLIAAISASDISSPGSASVTVYSPGPGGGTSGGQVFTIGTSGPWIDSVSPDPLTGSNSAQTLTIHGSSFLSGAQVRLRAPGVDTTKNATYVNSGQLKVSATFGTDPATWNAQVINPGGVTSGQHDFDVNAPAPLIKSLKPTFVTAGSGSFSLRLGGATFHSASVVRWNGSNRSTTPQSTSGGLVTGLVATISAADVSSPGSAAVTVYSPGPGGGTSSAQTFGIEDGQPEIDDVSPDPVTGSQGATTLILYGQGFKSGAQVRLQAPGVDSTKSASFIDSGELRVSATFGTDPATWTAEVINPGGGLSDPHSFSVNAPAPVIGAIQPSTAAVGSAGFSLRVSGSTFHRGSVVRWKGSSRSTTAQLSTGGLVTGLLASISSSDVSVTGSAAVTVYNPGPGGGTSPSVTFTVSGGGSGSGGFAVSSVQPNPAIGSNVAQTLTLNGSGFQSGAQVRLREPVSGKVLTRTATYINSGRLQASLTYGTDPATWSTEVINPGGATTAPYSFAVNAPFPVIQQLAPSTAAAGDGAFNLRLAGASFHRGSVVRWNGANRTTVVQVSTDGLVTGLLASISAADIGQAGTAIVTVHNPGPGGGVSAGRTFTIAGAATEPEIRIEPTSLLFVEGGARPEAAAPATEAPAVAAEVEPPGPVLFLRGEVDPRTVASTAAPSTGGPYHTVMQFGRLPTDEERVALEARGVLLLRYIPDRAYWVSVDPARSGKRGAIAEAGGVTWQWKPPAAYRTDRALERGGPAARFAGAEGELDVHIMIFEDVARGDAEVALKGFGLQVSGWVGEHTVAARGTPDEIEAASGWDGVEWVAPAPPENTVENETAARRIQVDDLQKSPWSLTGEGVTVGVWDSGAVFAHTDFGSRLTVVDGGGASNHGTHVAGTIGGSGEGDDEAEGMAPGVAIRSYDWNNDAGEMRAAATANGVRISNHSYGTICGWHWNGSRWVDFGTNFFGAYSTTTVEWDDIVRDTGLLVFKAAGNDRNDDPDGSNEPLRDGPYDTIAHRGIAKNVFTIGATTDSDGMSSFSSWGPADDGRVKPDLCANGVSVYSTWTSNRYATSDGTSMATPSAAGAAALLLELYHDTVGGWPTPDLLKGLMIQGATDKGRTGPDYEFGWGLIHAERTAELIEDEAWRRGTLNGTTTQQVYLITVAAGTSVLKATLAWTDPPGTPGAARALVNDLDLKLHAPNGIVHQPWILDRANPGQAARRGTNRVDNVEQVVVDSPVAGVWTARVHGAIAMSPQTFSLIAEGFTESGPSSESFTISNDGAETLNVTSIAARDGDDWLDFTPKGPFTVEPGDSREIAVTVDWSEARAGANQERILVYSDDRDRSPFPGGVYVTANAQGAGALSIDSVNPDAVQGANVAQTLVINGSGFEEGAQILLSESVSGMVVTSPAAYFSSAQLQVSANLGTEPGTWVAEVVNPGGEASSPFAFGVNAPVPAVESLMPASAAAGSDAFELLVGGDTFHQGSVVRWNGVDRPTLPQMGESGLVTGLVASIEATDVADADTAAVTVFSSGPGGGESEAEAFVVAAVEAPTFAVTSVVPERVTGSNVAQVLVVRGIGFEEGAQARLREPSAGVDTTVPAAFIDASEVAVSATFGTDFAEWTVEVINPGGAATAPHAFFVDAPAPTILSLTPPAATAGSGALNLFIGGDTFQGGSVVQWNGSNRVTVAQRDAGGLVTGLVASLPAADVASTGTASVAVVSPGPGGGASPPLALCDREGGGGPGDRVGCAASPGRRQHIADHDPRGFRIPGRRAGAPA